jgi:DNA ligase (NAD+)
MRTSILPKPRLLRLLQLCLVLLALRPVTLPGAQAGVPPEVQARVEDLRTEIGRLDEAYFRRAQPEASDAAYDGLKRELASLERAYPALAESTVAPGDDRSGLFRTARHRVPMTGLDKVYAETDLRAFVAGVRAGPGGFVIEPKVDGVALSLTYESGRLVRVLTRGDGTEGDDVTELVRHLPGVPAELAGGAAVPAWVELRGELHVPLAAFVRMNRTRADAGEPPLANPRAAAAGALRQTDPRLLAQRSLAVVIHGFGAWEPVGSAPATQVEFQARVRAWGLLALSGVRSAMDADGVWRAVEAMGRERAGIDIPTEGVVVKVNTLARQRELGESPAGPRWAVAFKFTAPRAITRLLGIELQVGRTGLLTPVAQLEPVPLAGSVVTRATLHNAEAIARLDLRIGDTVVIENAGEVIPLVAAVEVSRRPTGAAAFFFPVLCPACGTAVEHRAGEAARRCPNEDCPAQLAARLEHLAESGVLDLPGLGPALSAALVASGRVRTPADLFRLEPADLVLPGRPAGAAATALHRAIGEARAAGLRRWILALSIPGVGEAAAEKLAAHFSSLSELSVADTSALRAAGLGERQARDMSDYLSTPRHLALIRELESELLP